MRPLVAVAIVVVALGLGLAVVHAAGSRVTYIPADDVRAGFEKGAVLVNDGRYQVHASRREASGQVEVHVKDTDIIYMLEGTTTFVTGGRMIGGQTTAPDEIRGPSVEGGDTRVLKAGDIIIVPKGTPHWFKDVSGPVLYYVVKATAPDTAGGTR